MTIDELKKKIGFTSRKMEGDRTVYDAGIVISAQKMAANYVLARDREEVERIIKEDLTHEVLSMLYENQIKEHAEAIMAFTQASQPRGYWPEAYNEWQDARDKLMKLARTMPPKP